MSRRYSKHYSNYILKKKYQYTTKGTIWERDWVTIGAKHQIEKGKIPFYGDSGFLFTDNSFVSTQKRHDFGKVVAEWHYDDVKDAKREVNEVRVNYSSNDIRDFAYYGSSVELIRSSIYNIIKWFPGCVLGTYRSLNGSSNGINEIKFDGKTYNLTINQFGIDFSADNLKESEVLNPMRFMSLSNSKYEIISDIKGSTDENSIKASPIITYKIESTEPDRCKDVYEIATVYIISAVGDESDASEFTLVFKVLNSYGKTIVVEDTSNTLNKGRILVEIRPIETVIDAYFDQLEGFEKLLLRTDTTPLYKNSFLKIFETDNGIRYAYRDYVWPILNDYCIDIESPSYVSYVEALYEMASAFDETWCDNLWRNMTHESLRNYDWTYTRTFLPGDEEDNLKGGNRLEKLVRIYGRVFDDLKRYIDGIKFSANISYDGFNNMPSAETSDRLEYNGWEIYSTIPNFKEETYFEDSTKDLSTVYLDYDHVTTENENGKLKWFNSINPLNVSAGSNDIDFLRSLSLSSKHIIKSKGTIGSIDMIMSLFGFGSDIQDEIDALTKEKSDLENGSQTQDVVDRIAEIDERLSEISALPTYSITERYMVSNTFTFTDKVKSSIANLVHYDDVSYAYDDPYEGVPFGDVELYEKKFIVPFYDSEKYYKGEFTFQSNGGWYKKSLDVSNINDYEETLSYLNVVPNFESLLSVNTFSLESYDSETELPPVSDIYYVVDPSDYVNYQENIPKNMTNYFYNVDIFNPQLSNSWMPVLADYTDFDTLITVVEYEALSDKDGYVPVTTTINDEEVITGYAIHYDGTKELYERAKYLDSIVSLNIGNNPHVGFGKYDLGYEYKEYMTYPFKYYEDNYILPAETSENTYSLRFSVEDDALSDYTTLTQEEYENCGYVNPDQIKFRRNDNLIELISDVVNDNGGVDIVIRLNGKPITVPVRHSVDSGKFALSFDRKHEKQFIDLPFFVDDEHADRIEVLRSAFNDFNYITYTQYKKLPQLSKINYTIDEYSLIRAINNKSDEYTEEYSLPLSDLYEKDHYTFRDFEYDLKEYSTKNKVKNVADVFFFQDGYVIEITKEEWEELDESERKKYKVEIDEIIDGIPTFKYVKSITKDEYDALDDEEKEKYYSTTVKIYKSEKYRDPEDYEFDTYLGEGENSEDDSAKYYLNSKLITIEFKNTNDMFKKYFMDVIGKYVMQVVPSTAITVVLFDDDNNSDTEIDNG